MDENKGVVGGGGESTNTQQLSQQHLSSSSPPNDPLEESSETRHHHQQQPPPPPPPQPAVAGTTYKPLFIPISGATSTTFEAVNPKRPRYTSAQWKSLPSPSPHTAVAVPQPAVSSSDTASSPSHSPRPSLSAASGQETSKPTEHHHQQMRKGKYVSPVWKPDEMLWLAKAWRVQYHGSGGGGGSDSPAAAAGADVAGGGSTTSRGKSRADKDREVAEFLNRHGVSRDAKTAGTKWDNMLGEFRKVYEWERGGEREQVGKSYFRLSPYERKLHRLPASFDEEVFEELSQFMGSRVRISQTRGSSVVSSGVGGGGDYDSLRSSSLTPIKALPPPPSYRDQEDLPFSGRGKQLMMVSGSGGGGDQGFHHGYTSRGSLLGFEPTSSMEVGVPKEAGMRRMGKIRMVWEESVSLWAEEGEYHRGRVKLQGSSFLNADELTFLDDSMVACTMEAFEDGGLKGFSVDRFVSGQQVKVFGRRKSSSSSAAAAGTAPAPSGTSTTS